MEASDLITATQLAHMGRRAFDFELDRGRMVRMNPTNRDHGRIAAVVAARLLAFVEARALGTVMVETGYTLTRDPDTVRGPDVSYIRSGRVDGTPKRGFVAGPPDLAVEVKSPDDTIRELLAKAREYLGAGAELVWIIDPESRSARVARPGHRQSIVKHDGSLDGEATLPGFVLRLADLFGAVR